MVFKDDSIPNVFDKLEARKLRLASFCFVVLVAFDGNVFDLSLLSLLVLDLIIVIVVVAENLVFFFSIDDALCFTICFGFVLGDADLVRVLLVLAAPVLSVNCCTFRTLYISHSL